MISASTAASMLYQGESKDTARMANVTQMAALGKRQGMTTAQIDSVSKDFESLFIAQMLEHMFGDSIGDDLFGDAETHEIYKGMMVEQYGKQISDSGGIGIADFVKKELLKLQEVH